MSYPQSHPNYVEPCSVVSDPRGHNCSDESLLTGDQADWVIEPAPEKLPTEEKPCGPACCTATTPSEPIAMDVVNHPPHYTHSLIEPIDVIEAWGLNFALGNVVKYVARLGHKGDRLEQLRKARWYLEREIRREGRLRE